MEDKMKMFFDTIIEDANEQKEKMLIDIANEKLNCVKKAEEEILHNIFVDIKKQISDIKNKYSRDLSIKSLEIKNELIIKRNELTSTVYSKLKDKLLDFTKTNDYKNYIKDLINNLSSDIKKNSLEIIVTSKDIELFKEISKELNLKTKISSDEDIIIGGFIIICRKKAFKIDETLDEKLILSHEYFSEISELVIN